MKIPDTKVKSKQSAISAEFFVGLLAIMVGGYNLLASFDVVTKFVEVPQMIGNILMVLAGLFLWITAYKLSRYKYHTKNIF